MRTRLANLGFLSVHHWERGFDMERQTLTSDPRNKVAVLWRRKFECPMILSTGRWKTTGKLGKRCHHGGIASPAEEETIDEAGRAAVLESDVEDGEQARSEERRVGKEGRARGT